MGPTEIHAPALVCGDGNNSLSRTTVLMDFLVTRLTVSDDERRRALCQESKPLSSFYEFLKQVCSRKQVLYKASDEAVYHIL
jgi:hypothetical protein